MGEVWKARDTRLNRDVAIKVLPEKVAGDPEALARFEREAKAVAALSHPNVLGIFDIGRDGATAYAVTELLVGQTLRERLAEGPLPQRKALEYALQAAHGLAAAHEKGVVHRDLKPENLFVTSDGRVKILDFGLAKVMVAEAENTRSPTALAVTEPGTVMGTVGYMSPEQVRGKALDARSDIFSLGSILYEMLTGQRAFQADSAAETMAAIAQKDPPELAEGGGRFPAVVERILRHCLEKRPEDRFDTAHDLAFAIETAMGVSTVPRAAEAPRASKRSMLGRILAVGAVAAALAGGLLLGSRLRRPSHPEFRQISYHRGYVESARFSPDGQTVIFGSTRRNEPLRIYSTRLDSVESRALDLPPGATVLGISRTGEMALLLKCAHRGYWIRSGTLARAALGGGAPREILEHVTDADISPDGKELAVVREMGKRQRLEFPLGKVLFETDGWVSHPRISPDGTRVAFLEHPSYGNDGGFVAIASAGGKITRMAREYQGAQGLAWSRDGKEIWFTGGNESATRGSRYQLWAVAPGGKERLVYGPPVDIWLHDISSTGAVILAVENSRGEIGGLLKGDEKERDLSVWSDESISGITSDGSAYAGIEQSAPGAGLEPFFYYRRAEEAAPVRLGTGTASAMSPDGRWILARTRSEQGSARLTLLPTGPGEPRQLSIGKVVPRMVSQEWASWSQDGRLILFPGSEPGRPARAWLVDFASGGPPRAVTPEGSSLAVLSPDAGSVATVTPDGKMLLCSVAGGAPKEIAGTLPGEIPLQWEAGGKALFLWDRTWPAKISRLELATGKRDPWKELSADPVGLLYGNVILAPDGRHYVYRLRRILSELNVAEGLK
jgi:serine/threonine protein kinase/Tol biopolymer transport system component